MSDVSGTPRRVASSTWMWSLPAVALVVITVIVPVLIVTTEAVDGSAVFDIWTRASVLDAIRFSIWQALCSTAATLIVGTAMAWILARYDFRCRTVAYAVVTAPFVLPTVVVASAFLAVLPASIERSFTSILLAHVFFNISVVVRLVVPAWSGIDPDLLQAARTLGASPLHIVSRLILPMGGSALTAAGTLVFVMSFTSYGVVRILGGVGSHTVEVEIYRRAVLLGDISGASVLAVFQTLAVIAVITFLARRPTRAFHRINVHRQRAPAWAVSIVVLVSAFVITPLVAMITRSLFVDGRFTTAGWRQLITPTDRLLADVDVRAVVVRTLGFALVAAVIAVPTGIAAALGLARRPGILIRALLDVPVATSAVVVGFGILVAYDTSPLDLRSSWWLIPLIHAVIALPFVVRATSPVVRAIPRGLRDAAAVLGASPIRRWWSIDAPLLRPAVSTAVGLSIAFSLGEFGATSFLTRRDSTTMPILIDQLLGRAGDTAFTAAMAASSGLLVLTGFVVITLDSSLRT